MLPAHAHNVPNGKPLANPEDSARTVTRTQLGIWDYYEEKDPDAGRVAVWDAFKDARDIYGSLPFLLRASKDLLAIPGCAFQIAEYAVCELTSAFVPALSVWFQGELLRLMEAAAEQGVVDTKRLLLICAGRVVCAIANKLLNNAHTKINTRISARVSRSYALRSFSAHAKLDLPTSERRDVKHQIMRLSTSELFGMSAVWQPVATACNMLGASLQLGAQSFVLLNVLRGQRNGALLACLTLVAEMMPIFRLFHLRNSLQTAWALTTSNADYLKLEGWKAAVQDNKHRKELVAGGLADFAISEYLVASQCLGDEYRSMSDVQRIISTPRSPWFSVLLSNGVVDHLPQVALVFQVLQNPGRLAEYIASIHLVQTTASSFSMAVNRVYGSAIGLKQQLEDLRKAYTAGDIPNVVRDGTVSFPSRPRTAVSGIALEFRNVSFTYPGSEKHALHNISFSVGRGQLCVIVGSNGAGKSTILKLVARLYDPDEGSIYLDGHDIRTLKLRDIRRAMSVLFQDYTHFPLSIRDNIALGDPAHAHDDARVRVAARLGGADAFIKTLADGYETYLHKPASGLCSGPPEGSRTAFGRTFDMAAVCKAAGLGMHGGRLELSGGQMQRLAVSRTFMRSVVREDSQVGLLLFDEPSASLDPIAEHDLFDRLRELRGSKTMVFSSHRFGQLTRHADLILYMDTSGIVESGTHEELLQREGEYARLWKIQAQAFAP